MVAILSTFRELGRLQQIYMVLMRHGFGEIALRLGLGATDEIVRPGIDHHVSARLMDERLKRLRLRQVGCVAPGLVQLDRRITGCNRRKRLRDLSVLSDAGDAQWDHALISHAPVSKEKGPAYLSPGPAFCLASILSERRIQRLAGVEQAAHGAD